MTEPAPAVPGSTVRSRFADALFGADTSCRRAIKRVLLGGVMYASALVGEVLGLAFGFCDPVAVVWLSAYMVTGFVTFYALVRSGWSERFKDRSLALPHILFAISTTLFAYPVSGPFRALCLLAASVPPLFGIGALSSRRGAALIAGIALVFGAMMATLAHLDPARFDPRIEALQFAVLASCMAALWALQWQISGRHERLLRQKVELSLALARIEEVSTRDELTAVFNRRHMTTLLADEAARRARGGAPFCLCLIDIDHFKRINDLHGHTRGDAVLRSFARMLRTGLTETDLLARWGGEEFLLLMPATDACQGLARLERLRLYCAEIGDWRDAAPLNVRFSAGLAEDGGDTIPAILDRADAALYKAKASGRDRIVRDARVAAAPA